MFRIDQRKQAKLQWLQDPSEVNEDNLSNVRRETSRHFRNKKGEYLKDKLNELESNNSILKGSDDGVLHLKESCLWTFSIIQCFF
jgi:hypothetical protein